MRNNEFRSEQRTAPISSVRCTAAVAADANSINTNVTTTNAATRGGGGELAP